jgi:hypothetical protein
MAERRMFAKTIIDSDAFLDMPLSTQALYFHLVMRADDEGFVNNPKKIMRMVGASDDEMKVLITKRFLIPFESGVVVVKHWFIHNYIQKDRFKPSVYVVERGRLLLKDNGAYTENGVCPECIQDGYNMDAQYKLKEVNSKEVKQDKTTPDKPAGFDSFWEAYPNKKAKPVALKAWKKLNPDAELITIIMFAIYKHKTSEQWLKDDGKYIPHPATWLNQRRWEDEEIKPNKPEGMVGEWHL